MLIKVSHAACEIRHYSVFQLESSRGCTASRCEVTHKDAPKLVQHPVRRRIEALHVLLRPPSHVRESLLGSTAIRLRCSICQAMTSGNEAAMVGEGCRGDNVVSLEPCMRKPCRTPNLERRPASPCRCKRVSHVGATPVYGIH